MALDRLKHSTLPSAGLSGGPAFPDGTFPRKRPRSNAGLGLCEIDPPGKSLYLPFKETMGLHLVFLFCWEHVAHGSCSHSTSPCLMNEKAKFSLIRRVTGLLKVQGLCFCSMTHSPRLRPSSALLEPHFLGVTDRDRVNHALQPSLLNPRPRGPPSLGSSPLRPRPSFRPLRRLSRCPGCRVRCSEQRVGGSGRDSYSSSASLHAEVTRGRLVTASSSL